MFVFQWPGSGETLDNAEALARRAFQEAGRPEEAAEIMATIKKFAPKYSLAASERMFPYPDPHHRARLHKALAKVWTVG